MSPDHHIQKSSQVKINFYSTFERLVYCNAGRTRSTVTIKITLHGVVQDTCHPQVEQVCFKHDLND